MIKKIAQKIGDREATIEIGIADHFINGDRDRNRDRDLNFDDRAHALIISIRGKNIRTSWNCKTS